MLVREHWACFRSYFDSIVLMITKSSYDSHKPRLLWISNRTSDNWTMASHHYFLIRYIVDPRRLFRENAWIFTLTLPSIFTVQLLVLLFLRLAHLPSWQVDSVCWAVSTLDEVLWNRVNPSAGQPVDPQTSSHLPHFLIMKVRSLSFIILIEICFN